MTTGSRWWLLWLLVAASSGCALTDVRVKAPESGLKAPIPVGNGRQIILAVPFSDARQIKNHCGVQKNGYGQVTASALCVEEPAQWIATFLARELTASGFMVVPAEGGARESALKIDGALLKIFVEPVVGFWTTTVESDLQVKLTATSRTGLQAERTFFVKGEVTSIIWPQGIFNDSLENGTRQLLTKMVEAILELMKQYPELGFRQHHPVPLAWRLPGPAR